MAVSRELAGVFMCDVTDLIGKPFHRRGCGPDHYNCWGLVMEVLKRFGASAPDYAVDAAATLAINETYLSLLDVAVAGSGPWKILDGPEPGAVVAIRNDPRLVDHMGVCLGNGKFIHIMSSIRVSIERLNDPQWRNKIAGYYRYAG